MERLIERINIEKVEDLLKPLEKRTDVIGIINVEEKKIIYRCNFYDRLQTLNFLEPEDDPEKIIGDIIECKKNAPFADKVKVGVFDIEDKESFKKDISDRFRIQNNQNPQNRVALIGFIDAL